MGIESGKSFRFSRSLGGMNPEKCSFKATISRNSIQHRAARKLVYRSLLATLSFMLLTFISGTRAAAQGAASPLGRFPEDIAPYLTPQRLVRIAGLRTINLVCLGQGSPTVVLRQGRAAGRKCGSGFRGHFHITPAFVRGIRPGWVSAAQALSRRTRFTKPRISKTR